MSTIRVTDSLIQNVPGRAIYFKNSDGEKHNVIWIERVAMHDIRGKTRKDYSTLGLDLKSAYVLIRNCDISDTDKLAIWIQFNSTTYNRVCEATISQNRIDSVKAGGVIIANNVGVNNAKVWIRGNTFQHNSALDKYDTIAIENCTVAMEKNLLNNNTGRAILYINDTQKTGLKHRISENTFWFNSAQQQPDRYTIQLRLHSAQFHFNVINNPTNTYEITALNIPSQKVEINCTHNWWGTGLSSLVSDRIRDGRIMIDFIPFLRNPPEHFGLVSK